MKTALVALAGFSLSLIPSYALTSKGNTFADELRCMKANIYFEARGESFKGKAAVAQVTANRVQSQRYPNSVCSVVFQPHQFSWTKQLPWAKIQQILDGNVKNLKPADRAAYYDAKILAEKGVKKQIQILPANVLHYHARSVNPKWAKTGKKYATIGAHIYYSQVK